LKKGVPRSRGLGILGHRPARLPIATTALTTDPDMNLPATARGRKGSGPPVGARRAQAPLYAALAQNLSEGIADGTYPVGTLLPTEFMLSEQYSVSRQTVREALRQLTAQGLLLRQPGIGTWVQMQPSTVRYTHSVHSFSDLEQYARELRLVIERVEDMTATGQLAQFSDG
jgi:DNA-binding transcriptional regulator YhcF (GntR family)